MSKAAKALERLLRGTSDASFSFEEVRRILLRLGFEERVKGSHHIFSYPGVPEILNLQPKGTAAKSYQVKQVRTLLVAYRLVPDGNP
ncbi:type II toxin-antitoxin system HicA family toxin [Rubrivirga marina]|uniref:Toxin HicA n=1 Tax=Rubrivirga marina TaxID=1196024 RepID=A0A271J4S4_9BACT|nr:type II toxin-antitoxin system HicA family toxin [Rubrivirga marina]PAP78298.1 toxin HicA [Rubrivirga marina]